MPSEIKESTLLHIAVYGGNCAEIELLLQFGSDVNAQNEDGDTTLHLAVRYGKYNAVPLLIEYGANLWIKNHKGHTPLCEAIIKQEPRICLGMFIVSGHMSTEIFREPEVMESFYKLVIDISINQRLQLQQKRQLEEINIENVHNIKNKTILDV